MKKTAKQTKHQRWIRAFRRFKSDLERNFLCLEGYEDEIENFRVWWWRTH